jgi:hypothetical protein
VTGLVAVFLAIAAGCIVSGSRRRVALVVTVPFVAILIVQTVSLAAGKGVSPPSTVTAFPGLISYYVVQVIILSLALGVAQMILTRRGRSAGLRPIADARRQTTVGLTVNLLICAAVVVAFIVDHPLLDPGSVTHHRSNGSPPIAGVVGILSLVVAFIVMAVMTLINRRHRAANDGVSGQNHKVAANVR